MPTVNTGIYGTAEQWERLKTSGADSDTLLVPTSAYFGETPKSDGTTTTDYMMGTLSTAYLNGKLQVNEPIDTSICPIGCDAGFQVRQVTYYPPRNNANTEKITTKVEGNVSLFFQTYYSNPATVKDSAEFHLNNATNVSRAAWAYDMDPSSTSNSNYTYLRNWDGPIVPITSMPVKSSVWCIFVGCLPVTEWTTVTSTPSPSIYDLNSYINGTVTISDQTYKVHEYYPEIIWIGVRLCTSTDTDTQKMKRDSNSYFYGASFSQEINDFQYNDDTTLHMLRYDAYPWTGSIINWRYLNNNNLVTDSRNGRAFIIYGAATAQFVSSNTANQWYGVAGIGMSTEPVYNSDYRMWQHSNLTERWSDIDDFKEFCLTQCAYFGMFFSDDYTIARDGELDAENMYLGIIDDSGITHGQYSQGQDNRNQKQWDWNDLISDSPYDPSKKPDPSIYDEETKLVGNTSAGTAFLHVYECSAGVVNGLKQYLYQIVAPDTTQEELTKKFLTVNPIDCITGCYEFPFTVYDDRTPQGNIIIGNTVAHAVEGSDVPLVGRAIINTLRVLDFGSVYYFPFYDDFRDYEPYSEALLYIPYVGYIPISPSEFMGHNIGLKMICDLLTGSCQALVYKDGLVIESSSGNIGTQVPITGIQQADYSNSIHGASTRLLSSQVSSVASFGNAISSLITGNVGGLVNTVANVAQAGINASNAKYELEHTKVPFKQSGVASPNINFSNEQQARLILKRPQMLDSYNPSQYGHTVGFACLITAPLSNFTGFTQATNVDLSGVTATVTEKQMIQQQLQSGVYL